MHLRTLSHLILIPLFALTLTACDRTADTDTAVGSADEPALDAAAEAAAAEDSADDEEWIPDNEILLADLDLSGDLPRVASVPVNITQRPGYDNQPAFLPDSSGLYYASIREDGQSDPYFYDIASGATSRVLSTPEPEYSPTPMADGRFSGVRVDADGNQQFWAWDPATGEGEELLPGVTLIGYFTWLDPDRIAMFMVEEPYSIYLADIRTGEIQKVIEQVGRGLKRRPGSEVFGFIDASEIELDEAGKMSGGRAWIATYDPATGTTERLVATPEPYVQDFAWTPDGGLLIGGGVTEAGRARILYWHPDAAPELTEVALLPPMEGVSRPLVTRMAVSPDGEHIAIVVMVNAPEEM
jgi:Tol biopolymer transport system component